ncbi:TetR/AcrR family transcriptional regulator [Mycolicibacterium smegmatis]|uniref:TetR-family protein transcriptional regulator n=4 Tax=Mycolicibacterium smegmatis TaxID=1772 RepID=A0QY35_MYCS2|nr:TetR/AcrR family transcriptional regulator [Mycolicibacterium smegmatis]ABK70684.1 TetR-family protein transcriptional regulator [Mycolicibacterium smegmatis MC2 155]AFP39903.1 TetR-family transcriptional regulator [Mycolicibacterium smegmatis MC2 155]AIU08658.1 TetR family transcriptional regulator [Mycolicibacterium smegmatis MC2 155]AIU15283.1 TetR family transcriptional regulator [Mycolicibacterium smegmatis]AIU21906.1 TetR family transcriptional regulator [Mycolicibacterium smegmatis]
MASPRERMVRSAAVLIRERGAHPTAIADVLAHSGAPRGSAYHYFPGGRTQLLCEAIDYASDHVTARLDRATDTFALLDDMVARFRDQLLASDFRAGCPVVAVAVEAGDPEKADSADAVRERAGAAFQRWIARITARLCDDGVPVERAEELATLITTSVEGAVLVARTTRDVKPLELVHRQLREQLTAATGKKDRP